ncbi:MAG: bifunctional hydroxymethylpyrimidine kinase/phosphomethylpyrimidine kinase [Candidatus Omnitrophica bacterium]|nr:bifunctional hydroxymethylpyrimidine kinase/phosphomethylpyrimidine kinase [Candidatus Omnitrophota bacterium]
MSLITIGTVALDNLETPAGKKENLLGGSGSHFAVCARLFTDVHLVSVVGKDFPKKHLTLLQSKGINLTSVIIREGQTFAWTGEYKKDDLNTAITHTTTLGVLENYNPQVATEQRNIPNVFMANFDPDIQMKFLQLMSKPKFIGMDTMNLWIDIKNASLKKLMKKVHMLIVNDGEARQLTEETNLHLAAKALCKMGPRMVVVKKGENGVLFYSKDHHFAFSAYPVEKVVDPTGAGDSFAGGIMGYLSKVGRVTQKDLHKAILYATTLSSYNVEGFGMAKTAPLDMTKVNARLKELRKHIMPVV